MSDIALICRFPHWNEYITVAKYATEVEGSVELVSHRYHENYVDPLGKSHEILLKTKYPADFLVIPSTLMRDTHPLSYGKMPMKEYPYKVFTSHTIGYSPWDYGSIYETISTKDPERLRGSKPVYMIHEKLYNSLCGVDWTKYEGYEDLYNLQQSMKDDPKLIKTTSEPLTFWLMQEKSHQPESGRINALGVAINWANLKNLDYVYKIISKLTIINDKFGLEVFIRYHNNTREHSRELINALPFVTDITDLGKYFFMDTFKYYLVDETSLGYETHLREAAVTKDSANIYYFDGLPAVTNQFKGVDKMGKIPLVSLTDLLDCNNLIKSSYPEGLLEESFPEYNNPDVFGIANRFKAELIRSYEYSKNLYK